MFKTTGYLIELIILDNIAFFLLWYAHCNERYSCFFFNLMDYTSKAGVRSLVVDFWHNEMKRMAVEKVRNHSH